MHHLAKGSLRMKIKCEICGKMGYLQQLKNYYRVRHYSPQLKAKGKYPFYYHQQSRAHAESQLKNIKVENFNKQKPKENCEHQKCSTVQKNSQYLGSKSSGCSLVWLGHQPATLTTRVQIPATAP